MELLLGYGAGLLTLINPCVLPVLPIVLASAAQGHRHGPAALAAGMAAAFVALGLGVTAAGHLVGLTPERVAQAGALAMMGFGAVMLVPRLQGAFAAATAGLAARADARMGHEARAGLGAQAAGGVLLGAVWSPCIGPTLGGAIALAAQGDDLARAGAIMAAFAAGVATLILALGYGARAALLRRRAALQALALRARPTLGAVFAATGLVLFLGLHHPVEAALLDLMPVWLQDLSVAL